MQSERSQALLNTLPDYISISQMLKATPVQEGNERFIYIEASNESRDLQNEVILAKALEETKEYYLKFGNLDLEHYTQIGRPNPAKGWAGIPNYELYEIGRPVDVRIERNRTFVKGLINSGSGPSAEQANIFWSSLTDLNPPRRWYPSVGGAVLAKTVEIDESTGAPYPVISKVRWSNIGFSKTPVNPDLQEVSTIPIGALAKCMTPHGIDLRKSLTAGYGTDSASLTGGSALRGGSSDRGGVLSYWDFRDQFAKLVKGGQAGRSTDEMVKEAGNRFNLSNADAAEYVERFLDDLKRALKEKS